MRKWTLVLLVVAAVAAPGSSLVHQSSFYSVPDGEVVSGVLEEKSNVQTSIDCVTRCRPDAECLGVVYSETGACFTLNNRTGVSKETVVSSPFRRVFLPDDCAGFPCEGGAVCVDGVNSFTCDCSGFSYGATCSDVCPYLGGWTQRPAAFPTPALTVDFEAWYCVERFGDDGHPPPLVPGKAGLGLALSVNETVNQYALLREVGARACVLLPETCGGRGGAAAAWLRYGPRPASGREGYALSSRDSWTTGIQLLANSALTSFTHMLYEVDGYYSASHALPVGWFHVTLVLPCSGCGIHVYLNGNPAGSDVTKAPVQNGRTNRAGDGDLIIARRFQSGGLQVSVDVDDVAFFNEALTAQDVMQLYDSYV